MSFNSNLAQQVTLLVALYTNQIIYVQQLSDDNSFSIQALSLLESVGYVLTFALKALLLILAWLFDRALTRDSTIKKRVVEQITYLAVITLDFGISISSANEVLLRVIYMNVRCHKPSHTVPIYEAALTFLIYRLLPQRELFEYSGKIHRMKLITFFLMVAMMLAFITDMSIQDTIRTTIITLFLVILLVQQLTQKNTPHLVIPLTNAFNINTTQKFNQLITSHEKIVDGLRHAEGPYSQNPLQILKSPTFTNNHFEFRLNTLPEQLSKFLMNFSDIGFVWLNHKGMILSQNETMNSILTKCPRGLSLANALEVRKLDMKSSVLLSRNRRQTIHIISMSVSNIHASGSIKAERYSALRQSSLSISKRFLIDFIQEIVSFAGTEIYDELCKHSIILFDCEISKHSLQDYQISMQIIKDDCDSVTTFFLQFVHMKERDLFRMRRYSYAIMRQLFKTFSHEFGTSLNYQLALTQTAEEMSNISEHIRESFFRPLTRQGKIMHCVVSDMIDYNRMLGKEFKLQIEVIQLKEVLEWIKDIFQDVFKSKNIEFEVQVQNLEFHSDQQRIKQVLVNLVNNAQKFTLTGAIKLYTRIRTTGLYRQLTFFVEDTGIGMTRDEQDRLQKFLDRGFKEELQISSHSVGFGFGLFISNQISTQLSGKKVSEGGGIHFHSELNVGSSFSFSVKDDNIESMMLDPSNSPYLNIDKKRFVDLRRQEIHSGQLRAPQSQQTIKKTPLMKQKNNLKTPQVHSRSFQLSPYVNQILNSTKNVSQIVTRQYDEISVYPETDSKDYQKRSKYLPTMIKNTYKMPSIQINTIDPLCNCPQILIVDDEVVNIMALQLMLRKYNLQTEQALNGSQCVQMVEHFHKYRSCDICHRRNFSLIFMDINMPLMDGFEATQEIQRLGVKYSGLNKPFIVACTAFVDQQTTTRCYDLQMDSFVTKPVRKQELENTLRYFGLIH